jgi:hypothetical protein
MKTRKSIMRSVALGAALAVAVPAIALAAHPFNDVPDGQWYSHAVDWAYDNNITTGISPTEFGGEYGFTRYQAVTMLERMDENLIQPGLDEVRSEVDAVGAQVAGVRDDMSTIYHAVVNGDGSLETGPSSPGVTSQKQNTGRYKVDFPADVSGCAWQATSVIAHDGGLLLAQPDPVAGSVGLAPLFDGSLDKSGVFVETWDSAGTNADRDFTVSVICTPENNIFIVPSFPILPLSP